MKKRPKFTENVLELKILQKKRKRTTFFDYKAFFEDNKNKLNKVWEGIKEIININKKDTQQIRNINNNGKLITEKKQIANIFNHFFCNIPKQIEKGIIPTQKTYDDFLTNPIEQSFKFDLTSDEEIITYIKTLKNNKSNGPFSISNLDLEQIIQQITP